MEKTTITLSVTSRIARLQALPGQDPSVVYGIVSEGLPQPADGLGYIVKVHDRHAVSIVAWIQRGVSLYATDAPVASAPARRPDLAFLRDDDDGNRGVVRLKRTGDMDVAHWTSSGKGGRYALELSARYLGAYAKNSPSMDIRTLAAVSWVALEAVQPAFVDVLGMAGDLSSLTGSALPDALGLLTRTEGMPAFRRFLAQDLAHARVAEVRRICAAHKVDGVYLQATHLFWIRYDAASVPEEDQRVLKAVEAAINRAILAASWLLDQDLGAKRLDDGLWSHAVRHACFDLLGQAPALFEASREDNPRKVVCGVEAMRGGEWDVRTRFALALEYLRLPTRLDCRYDCDVRRGVFTVEFAVPEAMALPEPRLLSNLLQKSPFDEEGLRRSYAQRMALLLAACAFGSSVGILHTRVMGLDASLEGEPLLAADVDRMDFAAGALPTLRRFGVLSSIDGPDDLLRALELEGCTVWGPAIAKLEPLGLTARHQGVANDRTRLSARLVGLLRADFAYELDVYGSVSDPQLEEEAKLLEEYDDSPLVAIMELEGILARIDQEGDGGKRPLYCANGTDRLIIGLAPGSPDTRYRTIRDATYAAKVQLSRLYLKLGDVIRALEAAEECVKIAPTSATACVELADLYARLDRFDQASRYLTRALNLVIGGQEVAYVYYRLAYALWQQNQVQLAAAAYAIACADPTTAEQASREYADLKEQAGIAKDPSVEDAKTALAQAGMGYPVTKETLHALAEATLGLVDEGVFDPSWQALLTLAPALGGDDLSSVLVSLRTGTPSIA